MSILTYHLKRTLASVMLGTIQYDAVRQYSLAATLYIHSLVTSEYNRRPTLFPREFYLGDNIPYSDSIPCDTATCMGGQTVQVAINQ